MQIKENPILEKHNKPARKYLKEHRILFVIEELQINGAVKSLLALLKALPADRYDISLFVFKHGGDLFEEIPEHVHVLPESLPYAIHRTQLKHAVKRAFKMGRPDLALYRLVESIRRLKGYNYHLWSLLPAIDGEYDLAISYTDGFAAPTVLKKTRSSKKACWIHIPFSHSPQKKFVYEALKKADLCVPVSEDTGKDLDKALGYNVNKTVVHNIVNAEECVRRSEEKCEYIRKDGKFLIVSVGRVTPPKFFDIIPTTAKILKDQDTNFEWYIIGDGDKLEELRQSTVEQGLEETVFFIGSRANPMPWIKACDVFVNPSRFEAWGMTVSEALCLGKAVITSDIPVFKEQITDGINGLTVEATPAKLAKAIINVLCNEDLRKQLEENAKKYPFTKDIVVTEFNSCLEKLSFDEP